MEKLNLKLIKTIIHCKSFQVDLHKHVNGSLLISANVENPSGIVYFATNESLLELFNHGSITLQDLYERSPSNQISILENNHSRIYLCGEVDIRLVMGEKYFPEMEH